MKNNKKIEELFISIKIIAQKHNLYSVILFGSYARKEETPESDLDLLFIKEVFTISEKNQIGKAILQLESEFDISIQILFENLKLEKIERIFLETIMREGKLLFGDWPTVSIQKLALEPKIIIHYELTGLSQKIKMKIKRLLYGQTHTKKYKTKIYRSENPGLVKQYETERIGIAALMTNFNRANQIVTTLEDLGARVKVIPIWISQI